MIWVALIFLLLILAFPKYKKVFTFLFVLYLCNWGFQIVSNLIHKIGA